MNNNKNPRLQFTDSELNPKLRHRVRRAEKAADKAEAAREKIPKVRRKVKRAMLDPETGKMKARLCFEEVDKVKPPSKLSHTVRDTPGNTLAGAVHREVRQSEDDNVGVESAHRMEQTVEGGVRLAEYSYRSHKLRPYREAAKARMKLDRTNKFLEFFG